MEITKLFLTLHVSSQHGSTWSHLCAQPQGCRRQMPCKSGLHVPTERSRSISGCAHPHLNPSTLAKWNSAALTWRVCGVQELLGWRGCQPGMERLALLGKPWGVSESHNPSDKGHRVSVAPCSDTWSTAGVGSRVTCFNRHCHLPAQWDLRIPSCLRSNQRLLSPLPRSRKALWLLQAL